jgi:hypothetical protein
MDLAEASEQDRLAPGTGMALVAMAAAVFVVCNDFTAPSVALPTIERLFVGGRPRWQPREVKSADRAVETGSFSPPGR